MKIQEDVMASFTPEPHIKNVNGLFQNFAASRRLPSEPPWERPPRPPQPPKKPTDAINDFVRHFGLDAASESKLRDLHPELQKDIMASFTPKPHIKDVNTLFQSFASTRRLRSDPVVEFVGRFGLNETSESQLRSLPWSLQEDIMANFTPKPHITDVNSLFQHFASTRRIPRERAVAPRIKPSKDPVAEFIERCGLDTNAENLLRGMPWRLQEDIMEHFDPSRGIENVNGLFMKFASTRRPPRDDGNGRPWKCPRL